MPDLVVVGAGTMGAWTALHAVRGGRSTELLDAYGPGNARASSGDETRIIRSSHGHDEFYARWSRLARADWIALGEATGERIFIEAGALWLAHRDDGFEAASESTLGRLGIPVERLTPAEIRARWPGFDVGDLAFGTFEPQSGLLRARAGVQAAAARVEAEGGGSSVARVLPGRIEGDRLLDVVDGGGSRRSAAQFVFACGPWLPGLFPDVVGSTIRVTRQDVLYLGPGPGDPRWDVPGFPSWVDYDATFYGIGSVDGHGVKIATDTYGGADWDPDTGMRLVSPASVDAVRAYCQRRLPDLAEAPVVESRVCQYESTADSNFLIDRHPDFSNVWICGGGSGHGFKHGPAIGRYVVSLLDGHQPEADELRFGFGAERTGPSGLRTYADAAH